VVTAGPELRGVDFEPEADRLRGLAAALGVGRRVHLIGRVARAEMPALMRSADVAACMAWHQPSGAVALEAMACGVPVVAATVGAMTDTVVHDVTGRLVPPKDSRALAESINVLLRDEFLRHSFGAAGRDRVRARYTWDRIAQDLERIYGQFAQSTYLQASTSS
jgi:glycosyltransferase involved in cell wall biosynthesis